MRLNIIAHRGSDCAAGIIGKYEHFFYQGKILMHEALGENSVKARNICSGLVYYVGRDEVVSPVKFELKSPYHLR